MLTTHREYLFELVKWLIYYLRAESVGRYFKANVISLQNINGNECRDKFKHNCTLKNI